MARKYDLISELYDRTCKTVVSSPQNWEAFLTSACRNYKLRFDEQLLVFAQRPDATAVLEIERWNGTFGRWVNRGATGIAVFDDASRSRQRLIHYFDISDTHPSKYSRPVPIWEMKPEYEQEITETLESTFGTLDNSQSLADAVMSAAQNAAEDNLPDYTRDLLYSVNDSFLEELDEDNISTIYRKVVTNSVAYMMMERLGIDTEEYFEREDFEDIINFNTPGTLNALGFATSDIAEMGLTEIAKTVMSLERQNRIIAENRKPDYNIGRNQNTERNPQNERTDIHDAGRLQTAQFGAAGTAGSADGTVLTNEGEVPEREPQGAVLQSPDELQAERASDADRTDGDRNGGTPDERDGGEGRLDREPESDGYDELGSEDEQPEEPSSGNRDEGSNLRLEYYDRSNEDKSLPFFGHDDTIREILATTPHLKATKDEIRAFYESVADEDKRTEYIKGIFNNDYTEVILGDGRRVGYKTYQNVLQFWEGSYLSFIGMTVKGVFYSEKADAGNAILDACQAMTSPDPVPLGEYRGFQTELSFDTFEKEYKVKLKGELGYSVSLGTDTFGNITRLDNALEGLPKRLEINEQELENVKTQFETAKVDVEKPFNQEEELKTKTARLNELNALLNVDKRENEIVGGEPDEGDEEPTPKSKDRER